MAQRRLGVRCYARDDQREDVQDVVVTRVMSYDRALGLLPRDDKRERGGLFTFAAIIHLARKERYLSSCALKVIALLARSAARGAAGIETRVAAARRSAAPTRKVAQVDG